MTYSQRQLAAVLTVCTVCQQAYYMTQPQPVCLRCQQKAKP